MKTTKMGRLAKILNIGSKVTGHAFVGALTVRDELKTRINQAKAVADGLAELKGASMKLGQMLSIQGSHLFPKEVSEILAKLQNSAPAYAWPEIERILLSELGVGKFREFERFEEVPVGAASIGQVHRAKLKTGEWLALKIQYPGVADAIDSEVDLLQRILKPISTAYFGKFEVDELIIELKRGLKQEVDYKIEGHYLKSFKANLFGDERFQVPTYFEDYSTRKVLAMSFEHGVSLKTLVQMNLPLESINQIAEWIFELLLKELYVFRMLQTDPNFANYLFQLSGNRISKIVLLDFGATREYSSEFIDKYKRFGETLLFGDRKSFFDISYDLKFIGPEESKEVQDLFYELCELTLEPLQNNRVFDYGNSDLPRRIIEKGFKFSRMVKKKSPPAEIIFLNRKLGGFYNILQTLGARVNLRSVRDKVFAESIV